MSPNSNQTNPDPTAEVELIGDSGATESFCTQADRPKLRGNMPEHQVHQRVGLPSGEVLEGTVQFEAENLPFGSKGNEFTVLDGMTGPSVLSIPAICKENFTVQLSKQGMKIADQAGIVVMQGPLEDNLFKVKWPAAKPTEPSNPRLRAMTSYQQAVNLATDAERVSFVYQVMGCKAPATFLNAVSKGYIKFPFLTADMVKKNPPRNVATSRGHMKLAAQGYHSTKMKEPEVKEWETVQYHTRQDRASILTAYQSRQSDQSWSDSFTSMKQAWQAYHSFDHPKGQLQQGTVEPDKAKVLKALAEMLQGHLAMDVDRPAETAYPMTVTSEIIIRDDMAADATGKYPITGYDGANQLMIAFDSRTNVTLMRPYESKAQFTAEVMKAEAYFRSRGSYFKSLSTDNELTKEGRDYFKTRHLKIEDLRLAPPHCHRSNLAERKVQDAKSHLIAICNLVPDDFPEQGWSSLVRQAELTHMMQTPSPDPAVSAYEAITGNNWNWEAQPMAIPGERIETRVPPVERQSTWAARSEPGWYVGPAEDHYRCYKVIIQATKRQRIVDTIHFYARTETPDMTPLEALRVAIKFLAETLERHASSLPKDIHTALTAVAEIELLSDDTGEPVPVPEIEQLDRDLATVDTEAPRPWAEPSAPQKQQPSSHLERVSESSAASQAETHDNQSQRVANHDDETQPKRVSCEDEQKQQLDREDSPPVIARASKKRGRARKLSLKANVVGRSKAKPKVKESKRQQEMQELQELLAAGLDPATILLPRTRELANQVTQIQNSPAHEYPARVEVAGATTRARSSRTAALARFILAPSPATLAAKGNLKTMLELAIEAQSDVPEELKSMLKVMQRRDEETARLNVLIDGSKLTWNKAKKLPSPEEVKDWVGANAREWDKQFSEKKTAKPIHPSQLPPGRKPSYLVLVLEQKKEGVKRVRAAFDGGHQDFEGNATARVAALASKKLLINHAVSMNHKLISLDIKDFFLNEINQLERPEFMYARLDQFAQSTIDQYNLDAMSENGRVLIQVDKPIYGLKQAAKVALDTLAKILKQNGYSETDNECIFASTVEGDDTRFVLHVDDFGISYSNFTNVQRLQKVLASAGYEYTVDAEAEKYCGFTMKRNWSEKYIDMYMPEYVPKALERFNLTNIEPADTPCFEISKVYTPRQHALEEDKSERLSDPMIKTLQEKIGVLRYLASALRLDIDVYTSKAASRQVNPTKRLMKDVDRIYAYLKKYPNLGVRFYASDMQIMAHTDASFDSEQGSRSRSGAYIHCGRINEPNFINGPIEVSSKIQKTISVSAAEAEYIALFECALRLVYIKLLTELFGHKQNATPIACDNTCAVGLANGTVADTRTKHVRRKFHWVREAVAESEYKVYWEAGASNIADFFTKLHSKEAHQRFTSLLLVNMNDSKSRVNSMTKIERVCWKPVSVPSFGLFSHQFKRPLYRSLLS